MDSLKDRAESHEHASSHNTNESKDPFLPMDLVKSGQREFQKKKVMKYVELLLTLKEYAVDGAHIVALSLVICYEDMEMLDINPVEVWNACINAIMAPQIQNAPVAEDVALIGIREHATEGSEAPESRGAQLLAQAMLSGNNVAMKQILSSFRGSFDVNFIARSHIENENTQVVEYPLASLALVMSLDWLAIELIKAGANLFTKDNINGRTIIYIALEKGSKSVLQTMLETHPGLDLNQPLTDEDAGYSAMHIAAR